MLTHALRRRRVPVFAALLFGSAAATVDSQTTTEAEFRHALTLSGSRHDRSRMDGFRV